MNAQQDLLPAVSTMGAVTLEVADLDAMTSFYRDAVGLTLLGQTGAQAVLGHAATVILVLDHQPQLRHAPAEHAGLFHTAILFAAETDLAGALYRVATRHPRSFTGSADHLVSKAFYFDDPEGNGVELYWDRPRTEWTWQDGSIAMASLPLDPNQFLRQNLVDGAAGPVAAELVVGHVHLKVGNIGQAREFYVDTLGFEVTAGMDSALFVSAGGYHHHVAMNTWQSRGAGPRFPALGLGQLSITVPGPDDLDALADRLAHRQIRSTRDGDRLTVADPWQNRVMVQLAG